MRKTLSVFAAVMVLALASVSQAQVDSSTTDYFVGVNRHIAAGGGLNVGWVQGEHGKRSLKYVEVGMVDDYDFNGPFAGFGYGLEIEQDLFVGGVMGLGVNRSYSGDGEALFRFAIGGEARYLLWETLQLRAGYTYGHGFTVGYAIQW